MKKILILFSIFYFLLSGYTFAQDAKPFTIPRPALPGPSVSTIPFPKASDLPLLLNLMPKKRVIVFGKRFLNQIKELKVIAFQSPFSFLGLQQNTVVFLLTLRGLVPNQVLSMTIFCLDKAVYSGPSFNHQVILKLDGYSNKDECLVVLEFKGGTLENKVALPKPREI